MSEQKSGNNIPQIGIGMLGYAFMGKAHSNAIRSIPYMIYPPPAIPVPIAISGRNEKACAAVAQRFGYKRSYTDWRDMLADEEVQLLDNGGPNNVHAEPSIMAAQAGKHVLCEKPMARTPEEAKKMLDAVEKAGVKHMVAFNYRFVPAVRQIRKLIDSGALGRIYHWRAVYHQEWIMPHYGTPKLWRLDKNVAGSGAMGDLGAHIIDLAHYLVGDVKSVSGMTKTFINERDIEGESGKWQVDVDDAFVAALEFENGAIGSLEGTRLAAGRKNYNCFEINAEKATVRFNLERLNELDVFWVGSEPKETQGFSNVLVTEDYHPWLENWWPPGHIIGWEHTFVHEIAHLLDCIVNDKEVGPVGATFHDGYKADVVAAAIMDSAATRRQVDVSY